MEEVFYDAIFQVCRILLSYIGKNKVELAKYIGKKVLFNLRSEFVEENKNFFQTAPNTHHIYGRITAVDEVGVWVENPTWKTRPKDSKEFMVHRMHFLIGWSNIISVGVFPDRKFSGEKEIEEKNISQIGFLPK